jgi:hypothetical protein
MRDVPPDDDSEPAAAVSSRERVEPESKPDSQPEPQPEPQPETRAGRRIAHETAGPRSADPAAVLPTRPSVVLAAVALTLLVVVSTASGQLQAGLALAFAGVVLAWGWPVLLGAPSPLVSSVVIALGAVATAGAAGLTRTEPFLRWVAAAVAVGVLVGFFHQLVRRDGRARLTQGAATTISGLAIATAGAPLAVLPAYRFGSHYVLAAGAALGLAALAELLARWAGWRRWMLLLVLVLGAGGSVGVSARVNGIPLVAAVLLGVAVAGISHALRRVLTPLPGSQALQAQLASGAASVLVVGVVVYLLARLYAA